MYVPALTLQNGTEHHAECSQWSVFPKISHSEFRNMDEKEAFTIDPSNAVNNIPHYGSHSTPELPDWPNPFPGVTTYLQNNPRTDGMGWTLPLPVTEDEQHVWPLVTRDQASRANEGTPALTYETTPSSSFANPDSGEKDVQCFEGLKIPQYGDFDTGIENCHGICEWWQNPTSLSLGSTWNLSDIQDRFQTSHPSSANVLASNKGFNNFTAQEDDATQNCEVTQVTSTRESVTGLTNTPLPDNPAETLPTPSRTSAIWTELHIANNDDDGQNGERVSAGRHTAGPQDTQARESRYLNLDEDTMNTSTRMRPAEGRSVAEEKALLLRLRNQGKTFSEIKVIGNFDVAESTLRGRYRAMTKRPDERPRNPKPLWTEHDVGTNSSQCCTVN